MSDRLPLGVDSQQNYNKVFELSSKTDKKKRQQKSSQKLDELNMVIHKFCSLRCFSTFQRLLNYKPSFSLPAVGREGLGGLVWIGLCSYSFISFAWPKETKGNFAIEWKQTKIYFRFVEREQNQELKKSQDCGGCVAKNLSFRCRLNQTRCAQTVI